MLIIGWLSTACAGTSDALITHAGIVTYDQPVSQTIGDRAEEHHWLFNAAVNDSISVSLDFAGPPLKLELYSPESVLLHTGQPDTRGTRTGITADLLISTSGTYMIKITTAAEIPTQYTLTLVRVSDAAPTHQPALAAQDSPTALPDTPTLAPEIPVTPTPLLVETGTRLHANRLVYGYLEEAGEIDRYTILGTSGQVVTIGAEVVEGSEVEPMITLYSPAGDILAEAIISFGAEQTFADGIMLPTTGAYILFVRDTTNQHTGIYEIGYGWQYALWSNMQAKSAPDTIISGHLNTPAVRDMWPLDLTIGDIISAAAVTDEASGFDPLLRLVSPLGTTLYLDDNSGGSVNAALRSVIAPQTGRYYLVVEPARRDSLGPYTLIWRFETSTAPQ